MLPFSPWWQSCIKRQDCPSPSCYSWEIMSCGSLEASWKCRPQRFSALAGNADSVALVLTINRASLLNRPCQTMQCPAESRDEDMGLQWSLAVPTSYQWQQASILTALSLGPCQALLQWDAKKQKTQAVGIKQRLDYPPNMSLCETVHLWIPHGSERKERHNFWSWLLHSVVPPLLVSPPLLTVCQLRWEGK